VCSFRCEGTSPEILEVSPEILDFPETPEKSPEYPGFTNKIVLSGDFQDSPIHPPLGDIKILSVDLTGRQALEPRPRRVGEVQGEVADDDCRCFRPATYYGEYPK
jgi:hypothetical protein